MSQELRILLLEDSAADAELVMRELRQKGIDFTAKRVWTEADFLSEVRQHPPQLILADYSLPGYDGLSALTLANTECPEVPFIFVSGSLGEETAIDMLHHGATDYVLKQRLSRLVPSVDRALRDVEVARERKRAEQALRESDAKYHRLYDSMMDAFVSVSLDGHILEANRAYQEILGYSEGELRQLTYQDLTPEKWHAAEARVVEEQILTHGDSGIYEKEYRRKDGTIIPVELRTVLVHDASGKTVGMWGIVRDIAYRKRAETAIRDAKSLYYSLVEHLPQCVFRKDRQGRFTYANKLFGALLGKTPEELLGKTDFEFCPQDLAEKYRRDDERVMQTQEVLQAIEENQLPDKPKMVVQVIKAPVRNDSGEIIGVQGILTDITNLKELEAKFLRAQRLESVGSLASGIAHDLNNILTPIVMCVPLLRSELSQTERLDCINTIETSALRAVGIARQMLSFARGREGQKTVFPFEHLLREVSKLAQETFPRSIQVELNHAAGLWPVLGNATQLHQVLLNLCVNARDAMPGGGHLLLRAQNVMVDDVYVSMHAEAKMGPHVHVQVSDTGTGISNAVRKRIFEPFFTTKDADKGTGLGLTTVLGIVKEHEGFISFTSLAGHGTTFDIYIPARPEHETVAERERVVPCIPRGQGERVLVVDDEPAILDTMERTLIQQGYQVIRATDGIAALELFTSQAGAVRVVVTDIMMPLMDGTTLCRILRRISPATPIIVSTGVFEGEDGQPITKTLAELGVKKVLAKPHTAETLLMALHEVLRDEKSPVV
jgi:PAS domain S-box-containing protein